MNLEPGTSHKPKELTRQIRELETLIMLNRKIAMQADLNSLLQTIVDCARDLIGAAMGGLVVVDEDRPEQLRHFKVSGVPASPELPTGHGFFMAPYRSAKTIRVDRVPVSHDIHKPRNHPAMGPFLGVPLRSSRAPVGSLFLAETPGGRQFTRRDEELLEAFATQAGIALEGVRIRDQMARLLIVEERHRISLSLHSSVAQTLFLLKMEISRCLKQAQELGAGTEWPERLEAMQELADSGLKSIRDAIFSLSDSQEQPDLPAAIDLRLHKFQQNTGIRTKFLLSGRNIPIRQDVALPVRNIVEEALTNIRKHSASSVAVVTLSVTPDEIVLAVQDTGQGLPPDPNSSPTFGIRSMQAVAQKSGGHLTLFTNDDGGTTVRAIWPNRRENNESRGDL